MQKHLKIIVYTNLLKTVAWLFIISKRKYAVIFCFPVAEAISRYFVVIIKWRQSLSEDRYHLLVRVSNLRANQSVKAVLAETFASLPLIACCEVHSNDQTT